MHGVELNYSDFEKQAFIVFNSIKHFRPFLLKSHTELVVPFSAVINLLMQREVGEKKANWVTTLQEYDIEIKPAKIVKGQCFRIMLAGASNLLALQDPPDDIQICEVSLNNTESKYADIIFYFKNGYATTHLNYKRKMALILKAKQYELINDVFFRKKYDFVLHRCLEKYEAKKVL